MEWRKSFQGRFEVSDTGKFRSVKNKRPYKDVTDNLGYNQVTVWCKENKKYLTKRIHRLVANAFIDNPNGYSFVNHKNGIKTDNRVKNLEWCTRQQNENHAFKSGLKNSTGVNNTQAKMNPAKVKDIRINCDNKRSDFIKYADKYNVHSETIRRIVIGETWGHVK